MTPIKFPLDVTDTKLREKFIIKILPQALASLRERTQPQWGKMTAQHMVEHLVFAFQMSTGNVEIVCNVPDEKLSKMKAFLSMNRAMPKGYVNPVMGEGLQELQFQNMDQAKEALEKEVQYYLSYYEENPSATHTNPTFGELDAESWQKFHFKHCYHHLLQFGLIEKKMNKDYIAGKILKRRNFSIDPEKNNIKGAKFFLFSVPSLLEIIRCRN